MQSHHGWGQPRPGPRCCEHVRGVGAGGMLSWLLEFATAMHTVHFAPEPKHTYCMIVYINDAMSACAWWGLVVVCFQDTWS
jgi:hypothetical protein